MEIKIFGKSLFKMSSKGDILWAQAPSVIQESKYLLDFYNGTGENLFSSYQIVQEISSDSMLALPAKGKKKSKSKIEKQKSEPLTPKNVHELKMLHDQSFKLNTDPVYIDDQLATFQDKLKLIKSEEYDMRRGTKEIASIVQRMENRKRYEPVKIFFEEFPYTTTSRINKVIKDNNHLQLGQIAQFMADMPKEAIDIMKKYNESTFKLCEKQAVFYIIADKKDFKKADTRRDPILLAQSPFGHFWQILGAWDKEMVFLEEL